MKQMLLGIFLLVLSIWCVILGKLDDFTALLFIGVFLPVVAGVCFLLGFLKKER